MSLKDNLSPFYVWKRAFEKPYTTKEPLRDRPGTSRYRGFHRNDLKKCIGCGTCESICQNAAIDMVPVAGIKTTMENSGLRPQIDYGRCCWCALCVDICPSQSLTMSNHYIWIDEDGDTFRFIPGWDDKPWNDEAKGYHRSQDYGLLHLERLRMESLSAGEGRQSFVEIVKGYSREQAKEEAMRCVECGLCVASCPAHMDIPDYIRAVRENDLTEALQLLYRTNPLSGVCGRICTHKCEDVCALGVTGEPIAIRWLKRYIIDQIDPGDFYHILMKEIIANGKKVAIIGAGPGGLSAAYYLVTMGYQVTIFEASDKAGGMIRWGVPDYRVPPAQLDKDINYILSLGVLIHYSTRVGQDVSFNNLYRDYDAIFFSTGLNIPYKLEIPGEELPGIIPGLQLLEAVSRGERPKMGSQVAVIGGGNTAMDAARTIRRLGAEVTILYRRREEDMPADKEEISDARKEGIKFITKAIPVQIGITKNGQLRFIWNKAEMIEEKGNKRPRPAPIEGELHDMVIDNIITAIGQGPDFSFLPKEYLDRIEFSKFRLKVNEYGQTTDPKVFAGGDIVNDTADAISAIADGFRAAKGIDRFIFHPGKKKIIQLQIE
ncbi:MAG: FAD-dependent oxidoreductase [Candidatus Cloacimonetes bacterium]|nr:FAD-dependent oxidoreductase [Candidatus Cloacimonadota bacterium]